MMGPPFRFVQPADSETTKSSSRALIRSVLANRVSPPEHGTSRAQRTDPSARLLVIAVIGMPATAVVLRLVRFFDHQGDLGVAVGAQCRCILLVAMVNGVGIGFGRVFGRNVPSAARRRHRPMPRHSAIYRHLGLNWRPADCMASCRP